MKQALFRHILAALIILTAFPSLICADFYVIPTVRNIKNVITVAKSGGKFTNVKTAIDSITDAAENNPYLVLIGPGVYTVTQPIQLKAYVTVMGSGREATLLKGAISAGGYAASAIILGADNAVLTHLGVKNTGGNQYCIGIYNQSVSPVLENISVAVSGGTTNTGIFNFFSNPAMTHVTTMASGGTDSEGIYNYSSPNMVMTDVSATASGGTSSNSGVFNYISSPTMTRVTAEASGGTTSMGIRNSSSNPVMNDVTARASGGTDQNIGINNDSSSPIIRNCTIEGTGGTTHYGVTGCTVILSTVEGGADSATCYGCFDKTGTLLDATCTPY